MANEIYRILYVENNAEKVTQLKQLIRTASVDGKITFDINTTDALSDIKVAVNKGSCDLVLLQDSPKVPTLEEVHEAIGIKIMPVISLVNEEEFLKKRAVMIAKGAVDVGVLQQGDVLFKQIVRAVFEFKTQEGYRETLEKNAKLTELTAQFAANSENLIAYFGAEDGLFLYANEAFLSRFGFSSFNELAATTVLEYVTPEESAQFKKMMKIVGKTGKEQKQQLSLKNPKTSEVKQEEVILKQAMHDDSPCIEICVEQEGSAAQSGAVVANAPVSAQMQFYNRLTFIDNLSNFVGSSSWLVGLVLQDYFGFRKKHGVKVLEAYFIELVKHLESQISNLHYARYSDESIVLLLTNSDMTKVDRLGMAIVASAEGFMYQSGDVSIHGKFSFAYTNLGDSVQAISASCTKLDELAGLLDTRVVFTDDEEEANAGQQSASGTTLTDGQEVDEEYLPLYHALRGQKIKQFYTPVVDFSMGGRECYIATFNLYDEENELVIWNKSFTYTSNNPLMRELDQFMIQSAIEQVKAANDDRKKVLIPLSMYFLIHADELVAWIKENAHTFFMKRQILIGLAEEVIDEHFDTAKIFLNTLAKAGYGGMVYDVVDVTSTSVLDLNIEIVALSENCINRMSRSISSDEMVKLPKLLEELNKKGGSMLATGVNSPTSMTLVWEYNIPFACGNMIGAPVESLNFDFSQVMM